MARPPPRPLKPFHIFSAVLVVAVLAAVLVVVMRPSGGDRPLIVYCTQDAAVAEPILRDFATRTGIRIATRFESEDPKTSDLACQLAREKDRRRCDVFWDTDPLGTLDLQQRGQLLPYQSPGAARIPAGFKAADGSWTGCAARVRVIIANTAKIGTTPPNLDDLLPGSNRSKIALAEPLSGTARVHYTALWQLWGRDRLIQWHRGWLADGVHRCATSAAVKDAVADGVCFAGYTDTDAFLAAKEAGKPVAAYPVRLENGRTLAIPNTVAILRGTKEQKNARLLVDHLLSEEIALQLAQSPARLVPLGTVPADRLPAEIRALAEWAKDGTDVSTMGAAGAECLAWLKSEDHR